MTLFGPALFANGKWVKFRNNLCFAWISEAERGPTGLLGRFGMTKLRRRISDRPPDLVQARKRRSVVHCSRLASVSAVQAGTLLLVLVLSQHGALAAEDEAESLLWHLSEDRLSLDLSDDVDMMSQISPSDTALLDTGSDDTGSACAVLKVLTHTSSPLVPFDRVIARM